MGRKPGGSIMLRIHCLPPCGGNEGKVEGKKGDVPIISAVINVLKTMTKEDI
jgi:hypothetical protein